MAKDVQPDVILMDVAMPEVDGLEATRMLKQDPETSRIPVIACSAHVTQDVKEQVMQAGCAGFIGRPIEPNRLVKQITNILVATRQRDTPK